jgi:hypothetical protein
MTCLLFTADGRLSAEKRSLSRVAEAHDEISAPLLTGQRRCEIVPCEPGSWAFDLRGDDGSSAGGFRPYRLRRGGRLRVGATAVSLHGRPSSHEGWLFTTLDGRRVEATVASDSSAVVGESVLAGEPGLAVKMRTEEPLHALLALADVLALGCWLIVRLHSAPSTDHMLSSAVPDSGFLGGSLQAAVAGIL